MRNTSTSRHTCRPLLTASCCLLLWRCMMPGLAKAAGDNTLDHDVIIFVEPGDSYLKLFGADWLGVYQANEPITFFDSRGKRTATPEKLVVGMKLIAPAGTKLTELARERLSRYESIKKEALDAIREAEGLAREASRHSSEVFKHGAGFLDEARKMAGRPAYGFANYLEARRLAVEATKCFRIDIELYRASTGIDALKRQLAEQNAISESRQEAMREQQGKAAAKNEDLQEALNRQLPAAIAGLLAVVLSGSLWLTMRSRRRGRAATEYEKWLNGHRRRLGRLLSVDP